MNFTFKEISEILFAFKGNPRVIVQEECPPHHPRMAVVFNYHRQHGKRFFKFNWEAVTPVGVIIFFQERSHAWLKKNSLGQVTLLPSHASKPED